MSDTAQPLTDPKEIAAALASARALYGLDEDMSAVEITDPPVVIRTDTGYRVMAWLPVLTEDVVA